LIVDTDLFSDADDAGALAGAHALQDQGAVGTTRSRCRARAPDAVGLDRRPLAHPTTAS
jgi:hypothetical protein